MQNTYLCFFIHLLDGNSIPDSTVRYKITPEMKGWRTTRSKLLKISKPKLSNSLCEKSSWTFTQSRSYVIIIEHNLISLLLTPNFIMLYIFLTR